jgi:hypothetical protein
MLLYLIKLLIYRLTEIHILFEETYLHNINFVYLIIIKVYEELTLKLDLFKKTNSQKYFSKINNNMKIIKIE